MMWRRRLQKPRAMTERIYGKDIYTKYEQPASVTPVTSQHEAVTATDKKAESGKRNSGKRIATEAQRAGREGESREGPRGRSKRLQVQASAVAETSSLHLISADKMADKPEKSQKLATGKSPEPAGKNACPTTAAAVESSEEQQRRERVEADRRAWAARQAKIRDRENGTEVWFNPYA